MKYTTRNPTQLPTTPMAEYELVNINGMNSYLDPKTRPCTIEQYMIRGIATVMYSNENRSSRNTRGRGATGASRSKTNKTNISQNTVYAVLVGKSAAVKSRGNSDTCPATASGRKAPRYRRSLSASRLNGMMTSNMAFSCTCHPNKNEA